MRGGKVITEGMRRLNLQNVLLHFDILPVFKMPE